MSWQPWRTKWHAPRSCRAGARDTTARVTRRSRREAPAGGRAVRFRRTGTLSPPSLHSLARHRR
eukprot:scaffold8700_cov62-Phaeocystis_antarctica.AAC.10